MQSLAELGFIVVCIDGMGTPWRSKSFHEAYYGNLGDNTIPDQVAGMKELRTRSIRGSTSIASASTATPAAAMRPLRRCSTIPTSSRWHRGERQSRPARLRRRLGGEVGRPRGENADGTSNYDSQANQNFAKNLKGHLLLAHGTMDNNVPPNNTLLVVDALIKANKDFDLLMIPNVAHGYGEASHYMTRRRWDYFVRYLAGNIPPREYQMKSYSAVMAVQRGGPDVADDEYGEQ